MNKDEVIKEIKEMLESEGKAELKEFAEDLAEIGYKAIKIIVKHSENKIDDVVLASLDGKIQEFLDKIDGQEG